MRAILWIAAVLMIAGLPVANAAPTESGNAAPVDQNDGRIALAALEDLLRAFSEGSPGQADASFDPQMIGYRRLIDAMRDAHSSQKQIRIHLSDTHTVVSRDVVVIQTRWEKRYLALPAMNPGLKNGRSIFLMQRTASGWKVGAMSGDDPFTP